MPRDSARELMKIGRLLNDPTIHGIWLEFVEPGLRLLSDSYAEALEYSEQSLAVAVTPWDQIAPHWPRYAL